MIVCFYTLSCDVILLFVFSRQKPLWNATTSLGSFSHLRCILVMVNLHCWQALKTDPPHSQNSTRRCVILYYQKAACDVILSKEKTKEAKWLHCQSYEIISGVSYSFPCCTTYFWTWHSSSQLIPRKNYFMYIQFMLHHKTHALEKAMPEFISAVLRT